MSWDKARALANGGPNQKTRLCNRSVHRRGFPGFRVVSNIVVANVSICLEHVSCDLLFTVVPLKNNPW